MKDPNGLTLQSNNTTGYRGIYLIKASGKYRATVRMDGKLKSLGDFITIEEANNAREKEREKFCILIQ